MKTPQNKQGEKRKLNTTNCDLIEVGYQKAITEVIAILELHNIKIPEAIARVKEKTK